MGCKNLKPESPSSKKEQRPDHSAQFPYIDRMTGKVTWIAFDSYDKLQRCNAQRNIKHVVTWRPSKSEWA